MQEATQENAWDAVLQGSSVLRCIKHGKTGRSGVAGSDFETALVSLETVQSAVWRRWAQHLSRGRIEGADMFHRASRFYTG